MYNETSRECETTFAYSSLGELFPVGRLIRVLRTTNFFDLSLIVRSFREPVRQIYTTRYYGSRYRGLRRFLSKNIPNCAGFSFGFKARGRRIVNDVTVIATQKLDDKDKQVG
ncbi:MAG: hypothetical protein BECKG1743E_GA0114224_110891, partial [Candidatus Kentron sp. G]